MANELRTRLPTATLEVLSLAACIGDIFSLWELTLVCQQVSASQKMGFFGTQSGYSSRKSPAAPWDVLGEPESAQGLGTASTANCTRSQCCKLTLSARAGFDIRQSIFALTSQAAFGTRSSPGFMQPSGELVRQLWPALTSGFVFLVGDEWQDTMGQDAALLSTVRCQFRHDRIRQVGAEAGRNQIRLCCGRAGPRWKVPRGAHAG